MDQNGIANDELRMANENILDWFASPIGVGDWTGE